ncbi:putative peptidase S49, ClpP/crotonase-like domain-containing protein [Rosa chinensis]|uniref:Putative peptidase S49, ClpP/crotonase-like domain-containing protein n=1 Tax=Rosa chinensis TaxID=74649 RepID=A0A2P6S0H4_ROSCH|nr:putative peptidase S49, ClpP/crotonase-like domain-containing protein [Rosa chinensis]
MSEENCEMLTALLDNIYGNWLDIISSTRVIRGVMWREIKLLAASKLDIASMSDMAASGGYYMAMAADAIVAENLTLTSSIGVIDKMEEVAQGRVWAGKDSASRDLVNAIGGLSQVVAIAKLKANIPQDTKVTLVELARPSPSLPKLLSGVGSTLEGVAF